MPHGLSSTALTPAPVIAHDHTRRPLSVKRCTRLPAAAATCAACVCACAYACAYACISCTRLPAAAATCAAHHAPTNECLECMQ